MIMKTIIILNKDEQEPNQESVFYADLVLRKEDDRTFRVIKNRDGETGGWFDKWCTLPTVFDEKYEYSKN